MLLFNFISAISIISLLNFVIIIIIIIDAKFHYHSRSNSIAIIKFLSQMNNNNINKIITLEINYNT